MAWFIKRADFCKNLTTGLIKIEIQKEPLIELKQ